MQNRILNLSINGIKNEKKQHRDIISWMNYKRRNQHQKLKCLICLKKGVYSVTPTPDEGGKDECWVCLWLQTQISCSSLLAFWGKRRELLTHTIPGQFCHRRVCFKPEILSCCKSLWPRVDQSERDVQYNGNHKCELRPSKGQLRVLCYTSTTKVSFS